MRILVVTDAWHPQTNGVVRTYERLAKEVRALGCEMDFVTPNEFFTVPCPTYPEIRLSLTTPNQVGKRIKALAPGFIHIATEGPIGLMARTYCQRASLPFTTSYHTRFPEYISARFGVGEAWCYAFLRRFHNSGCGVMVSTMSIARDLEARGFKNILKWSRGVDTEQFQPRATRRVKRNKPVFLYVGRVSIEKNIEAFLDLDLQGRKVVVGDGPQLDALRAKYQDVIFMGPKYGKELARYYAQADVFVFPSRTDTFGLVLLEALASGVPVAAYPVTGPKDIIASAEVGVIDNDLRRAALEALSIEPERCREHALTFSWAECARQFIANTTRTRSIVGAA